MNLKQELGEKIKRIRKQRGLTQEQLAEMIDISSRNLCNIELGINFPKAETLEKILKTLNISTQQLFANNHIKTQDELIEGINQFINKIKLNPQNLELIYKILQSIAEN